MTAAVAFSRVIPMPPRPAPHPSDTQLVMDGRRIAKVLGVRRTAELFHSAGIPLQIALLVLIRKLPERY